MSAQSRSLRVRALGQYLQQTPSSGAYLNINIPVSSCNSCQSARFASSYPTTLRRLRCDEFDKLAGHGAGVAERVRSEGEKWGRWTSQGRGIGASKAVGKSESQESRKANYVPRQQTKRRQESNSIVFGRSCLMLDPRSPCCEQRISAVKLRRPGLRNHHRKRVNLVRKHRQENGQRVPQGRRDGYGFAFGSEGSMFSLEGVRCHWHFCFIGSGNCCFCFS
jgi:hypothetical protein